jgi:DNA-binding NtrC family response regulator
MRQEDTPETLLIVDDDASMRRTLAGLFGAHGYRSLTSENAEGALELLQAEAVDVVLTDLRMPGMKGDALLQEIRGTFPEIPVIAITAFGSVDDAMKLTRAGAADYIEKPFRTRPLLDAVERVLRESAPAREQARLRRQTETYLDDIVGTSPPMLQLFDRIARVSSSPAPVLITGESGAGKEPVARAVHRASGRGTFLAVNCGAIPDQLLESELFGHVRGAFTGATEDKPGLFEAAGDGTLFLDEIAELPAALQPKLLRAIDPGEIRRVGELESRRVEARIVAATNRDLEAAVEAGEFREDLFWRLSVLRLEVPPLRDRASDIPLLVEHFLSRPGSREGARAVRVDASAMKALGEFHWPGNVRQLFHTIEATLTFARGDRIGLDDLPEGIRRAVRDRQIIRSAADRRLTLAELERDYIFEVLCRVGGNKSRAADLLGIPRRTLYRRLAEYASEDVSVTGRHTDVTS